MENLIKIIILCFFPFLGSGQIAFYKIFSNNGNDFGQGIVQLEDSSYVITGASSSFDPNSQTQAFLLKIDSLGNKIWTQNYGGSEIDWGRRVLHFPENGFYVAGYTNSIGNGAYDFYLNKTDLEGNLIWEKSFGSSSWEMLNDAIFTSDSSIVMVGQTLNTSNEKEDIYIVKTNMNGNIIWTKQIGDIGSDIATSIEQLNDSTYIIAGQFFNPDSLNNKGWVMSIDSSGAINWEKQIGSTKHFKFNDFTIINNQINLVGTANSNNDDDYKGVISKVDVDGNILLLNIENDSKTTSFENIVPYNDNNNVYISMNLIIDGVTYPDGWDLALGKYTESLYWDNASLGISHTGDDISGQLISTNDGGLILIGYSSFLGAGGNNINVVKIGKNDVFPNSDYNTIDSFVKINETNKDKIKIYPNPTRETLYFEFPKNEVYKLNLIDTYGQVLLQNSTFDSKELNLNQLNNGIYFIELIDEKGTHYKHKIILNH